MSEIVFESCWVVAYNWVPNMVNLDELQVCIPSVRVVVSSTFSTGRVKLYVDG